MCVHVCVCVCVFVWNVLLRCAQLAVLHGVSVGKGDMFVFFVFIDDRTRNPMGAWQVTLCMVISGVFCVSLTHTRAHTLAQTHTAHMKRAHQQANYVRSLCVCVAGVSVPFDHYTFEVHSFVFSFFEWRGKKS